MKCQEANEWMNRYLDHDLSEIETKQLFQHLDSCPDCAETFDMLKRISAGLDSLPDVKPGYSLVDSILSRLDEIDRSGEQAEIKQETSSAPSVMKPLVAEDDLQQTDKSDLSRVRSLPSRTRRLWTRVAGGAAAVVILGFCIYQFQPKEIPNAEPAVQQRTGASPSAFPNQESSDLSAPASSEPSDPGQAKDSADSLAPGIAADRSSSSASDPVQSMDDAGSAGTGTVNPTPSETDRSASDGQTSDQGSATKGNPGSDPKQGQQGTDGPAAPPKESAGSGTAKVDRPVKVETPPASTDPMPSDEPAPDSSDPNDNSDSAGTASIMDAPASLEPSVPPGADAKKNTFSMGIQATVETNVWDSPNGQYVAKLEDGHLNVYLVSSGELTKIYDDPVNGEWKEGSAHWSKDGLIFFYTVIEETGPVESQVDAAQAASMIQK